MIGIGTIINSICIILGSAIGYFSRKFFNISQQESLNKVCGISIMFIAIAGVMSGMLKFNGSEIIVEKSLFVVLCIALGTIVGELIGIERWFESLGEWLKIQSGNGNDSRFVDAFVTASLTVSIGAMGVVGSIQDGLSGDYSTLVLKAVLDFIIIAMMTSSMGIGSAFSVIPVFVIQISITFFASLVSPYVTTMAVNYLSLIGSVIIFSIGVNLVWGKKINVANMLPAIIFAVLAAYLPWSF
ncbi:MAG: DUF554 domain-containing protein [Clostridiales bacterium]|nr:DUF554 domain-containing protein [Clostridiales bacterium]